MRLSYIKHDTRLRYATEVRCVNHLYVELKLMNIKAGV